jgi:hypothetical protein
LRGYIAGCGRGGGRRSPAARAIIAPERRGLPPPLSYPTFTRELREAVRGLIIEFILPRAVEFYRTAEEIAGGEPLRKVASWILG